MIKDALYAVTHGQDLSYDLAKDTMMFTTYTKITSKK